MTILRPFTAAKDEYDNGLLYPTEDGLNELGRDAPLVARRLIREALADFFAPDLDVYVGGGIPWYSGQGTRQPVCRPDAFVAFGARFGERVSWRLDREGIVPAVCAHVETPANRRTVFGPLKARYERLRVTEYLVFGPDHVVGFRLRAGQFRPIRPGADGGIRSRLLGLRLVIEYGYPRFVDATTGEVVLTRREQALRSLRAKRDGSPS